MMRKSGQNPVTIVVLLLVIAIAVAFIVKVSMPKRYPRPIVDWTCDTCDYRLVAEAQRDPMVCPEDSGEAVRTYYYFCSVHNHLFEAYRSKPDPDMDPEKMMMGPEMGMFYKLPGGEWTKGYPMEITCPEGNADRKTLKYCPPGAEERQEQTP